MAGIHTVQDYLNASRPENGGKSDASLHSLDSATRRFLEQACRGIDSRPVKPDPGYRKSYSIEDSMVVAFSVFCSLVLSPLVTLDVACSRSAVTLARNVIRTFIIFQWIFGLEL